MAETSLRVCYNCLGRAKYVCQACRTAEYCCRRCQMAHWSKYHRDECHPAPPPGDQSPRRSKTYVAVRVAGGGAEKSQCPECCGFQLTEHVPICMEATAKDQRWGMFRTVPLAKTPFVEARYKILGELGKGAFGSVTSRGRIRDRPRKITDPAEPPPELDRVAIKIIDAAPDADAPSASANAPFVYTDIRSTLLRELELRNLHHPNVVGICEAGFVEPPEGRTGKFAVTMDVSDGDLFHYLRDWRTSAGAAKSDMPFVTAWDTAFVMYQILQGIAHLHRNLIVHFDIKSANVLLYGAAFGPRDREGRKKIWPLAKMSDTGISHAYYVAPLPMLQVYTEQYRPPELLLGNADTRASYACETWAAAAVMYEVATGEMLFPGDTAEKVLASIVGKLGPVVARNEANKQKWFPNWNPAKFPGAKNAFEETIVHEINRRDPQQTELINLLRRMLTYDPEMRPSIFDVLKDDYFKNIGAASRWEMLRDRVLKFPEADESPELQKHPENIKFLANGTVAPKWALEVFKHRETGFFKNWAPDTRAANRDRRNIFLDAAKRLLVLGTRRFGQGTADTTEVLFAALEFLRWYFVRAPMDILGESWARDRYGALTAACMRLAGMYRTFGRGGSAVEYRGSWRSQTLGDGTMCLTEESIYMEQRRVLEMLDYNLAMSSIFDCAVQHARDKIPGNIWTSAEALFLKCVAICAAARVVEHTSIFYSQSYIALSCCDYVGLGMDETSVPPKRDAEKVEVFKQITRTLRARLAAEDDLLIRAWSSHSPEAVAGLRDIVKKMASMYPE